MSISDLNGLCQRLLRYRNDAIGVAVATKLMQAYQSLSVESRNQFYDLLLEEYGPHTQRIIAAARAYEDNPGFQSHLALVKTVETPRQRLFKSINMAPGGTTALVRMREDLLRQDTPRRVRLRAVDHDLRQLLQSWFNRGFLQLRRIDWDSPASLLEKIITYEAVHQIEGWDDLHRRLKQDRRCFAFFHPSMVDEPLVFVEVALTDGIPQAIQPLLARDSEVCNERDAKTAIFYSISNCQTGLRGVSFGGFLIKQVVDELTRELRQLDTFATLSPVPSFMTWLTQQYGGAEGANAMIREATLVQERLTEDPHWFQNEEHRETLRSSLMHLCAHYLVHEKLDELPIDPVSRFHLGNGASLHRMNWLADISGRGMTQSAGIMVNYLYELDRIEENHDRYVKEGTVAVSKEVQQLAN
jgi:malonyl-CoA decarboxylase